MKLRAQITSLRLAQASRIRTIAIGIDSRAAPGRGFRHHGDADIGGDHLADRIEIPQPRPEMQAHAEPRGVLATMCICSAVARRQADEIAAAHLAEIDLAAAGERPRRGATSVSRSSLNDEPLDIVGQRVLGGKAEIGGAGRDRRGDIGAFALLDVDD